MTGTPLDIPASDVAALVQAGRVTLVDCREPWEHELAHLAGSVLIPLAELPSRTSDVPRDRDVVVYCHHGMRSRHGALILRHAGVPARSLEGGIDAWSAHIDPTVPRY